MCARPQRDFNQHNGRHAVRQWQSSRVSRLLLDASWQSTKYRDQTKSCTKSLTDLNSERLRVDARQQLDIGRNEVKDLLGIEAHTISTHHLRIRCIIYEEDNEHCIAPMIYFRVLSFNSVELKRPDAGHNTDVTISRGHGDILLGAGDVIKLTPDIYLQLQYHASVKIPNALDELQRAEAKCFSDRYHLSGRRLGVGGFASVYVAIQRSTNRQLACKAIPLQAPNEYTYDNYDRELRMTTAHRETKLIKERQNRAREFVVLEKLDHPNIISLERVICASHNTYIFQELVTGGDLLSYMDQKGALSEPEAAVITLQLLKAVDYLHSNGYAHRDIKPENVLMTSWKEGARIVLTDFGHARAVDSEPRKTSRGFRMQSFVGTYGYAAPEIIVQQLKHNLPQKGHSKAVDLWSVGCVTAALLTGETIFPQDEKEFEQITEVVSERMWRERWDVNIIDKTPLWAKLSRKAKSFVKGCLAADEGQRLTAKQALSAEWLTNKHYATALEAVYDQAIANWRPRVKEGSLIECIDTASIVSANLRSDAPIQAEVKSKHFTAVPNPLFVPPSTNKKPPVVSFPKPQPAHQAPMSRAPNPLPSHDSAHDLSFSGPAKADNSFSTNTHADCSGGTLSIWQHAPPKTQLTAQTQGPMRPGYAMQTQSMLDESTQTQLRAATATNNASHNGVSAVDSQETQVHTTAATNERPRKKVCR